MAKKIKKPSKRGKKAKKKSLHCSPMIIPQEKIMRCIGWMKSVMLLLKTIYDFLHLLRSLAEYVSHIMRVLWSAL